jgi:hypothetical protein
MPFTFVVEDGTGIITANSYVSVTDASDILTTNIHAGPEWDALDTASKERLLAWASRYLDDRVTWRGYRVSETSGLRWPRSGVIDRDGILISSTTIPRQLKVATAEMARYLIETDRSVEQGQDALTRLKADVIELEFAEGYRLPKVPEHMQYLLSGLGSVSGGGGVQFKRIVR